MSYNGPSPLPEDIVKVPVPGNPQRVVLQMPSAAIAREEAEQLLDNQSDDHDES